MSSRDSEYRQRAAAAQVSRTFPHGQDAVHGFGTNADAQFRAKPPEKWREMQSSAGPQLGGTSGPIANNR